MATKVAVGLIKSCAQTELGGDQRAFGEPVDLGPITTQRNLAARSGTVETTMADRGSCLPGFDGQLWEGRVSLLVINVLQHRSLSALMEHFLAFITGHHWRQCPFNQGEVSVVSTPPVFIQPGRGLSG